MLGVVTGAHGVRGEVKVKTFTAEPRSLVRYGALEDESGARRFKARIRGGARGLVIAAFDGVATRDQAEALKGVKLYVARAALPKPKRGEYYIADLVGLAAVNRDGTRLGRVSEVLNYGAGDVLEIARDDGTTLLLPFADRMVPEVDIAAGRIVIEPPQEIVVEPSSEDVVDAASTEGVR
jgi:16S rRNA processing protein RimM